VAEPLIAGKIDEVMDLGIDKEPQVFMDAIKEHNAKLIGMSAFLTTPMPKIGETIFICTFHRYI
jgi:5-methyltetrahydrofolate--homocysteine methyltransferase